MLETPWLFGILIIPVCFLVFLFLSSVIPGINIFITAFFVMGIVMAAGLFFIKKSSGEKSVCPVNGSLDENYEALFKRFSEAGLEMEEYEPLNGRQLKVFLDHPAKGFFIGAGLIFTALGFLPGIVWFLFGRDKFSITFKENVGHVYYIFESNSRFASRVWQKVNLKITRTLLGFPPEDSETNIDLI